MTMLLALLLAAQPAAAAGPPAPAVAFDAPYDRTNPFARILRGELPVATVYADRDVLAFMDAHPRAPGHVLVIARRSTARNALEMDPALYARLMRVAQRIGRAQRAALHVDGFIVQQNNGIAQSVPHLHVHVVPVYAGRPLAAPETTTPPFAELEREAAILRRALR